MSVLKYQINLYQKEFTQHKKDLRSLMKEKNTLDAELEKNIKYNRELFEMLQSYKMDPLPIPIPQTPLTYNQVFSKIKNGEYVSEIVIILFLSFFVYIISLTVFFVFYHER